VRTGSDALEEERLFAGRYDGRRRIGDASSGAGGTDARIWPRWSADGDALGRERGFNVELLELSPGEEAGIKVGHFRVSGERTPTALYGSEKGYQRLVRLFLL